MRGRGRARNNSISNKEIKVPIITPARTGNFFHLEGRNAPPPPDRLAATTTPDLLAQTQMASEACHDS